LPDCGLRRGAVAKENPDLGVANRESVEQLEGVAGQEREESGAVADEYGARRTAVGILFAGAIFGFFPSFFGTPLALALPGVLFLRQGFRRAGLLFIAASVVYLLGGLILTMAAVGQGSVARR